MINSKNIINAGNSRLKTILVIAILGIGILVYPIIGLYYMVKLNSFSLFVLKRLALAEGLFNVIPYILIVYFSFKLVDSNAKKKELLVVLLCMTVPVLLISIYLSSDYIKAIVSRDHLHSTSGIGVFVLVIINAIVLYFGRLIGLLICWNILGMQRPWLKNKT